ncbi:hypothetical protein A6K76_07480 [Caryophanon latum]|uniref:Uncharacterized protein n=1 Tax=Caryophanon latum TaxID=33977 RepID=A0A1C0YYM3_9BACL|nr:hypothetical protein A6K76_07480 [Caryophanon latum]
MPLRLLEADQFWESAANTMFVMKVMTRVIAFTAFLKPPRHSCFVYGGLKARAFPAGVRLLFQATFMHQPQLTVMNRLFTKNDYNLPFPQLLFSTHHYNKKTSFERLFE